MSIYHILHVNRHWDADLGGSPTLGCLYKPLFEDRKKRQVYVENAFQLLTHGAIAKTGKCCVCMITLYLYCFLKE